MLIAISGIDPGFILSNVSRNNGLIGFDKYKSISPFLTFPGIPLTPKKTQVMLTAFKSENVPI